VVLRESASQGVLLHFFTLGHWDWGLAGINHHRIVLHVQHGSGVIFMCVLSGCRELVDFFSQVGIEGGRVFQTLNVVWCG
jgi:hypothetical protein